MKLTLAFKHTSNGSKFDKFVAWCIKKITKSKYYHVECIIDNKWISSDNDVGVRIKQLKPLKNEYDYIELTTSGLSEEQNKIFWEYLEDQQNTGYDYKGIFLTQLFMFDLENNDKWFCSEIVVKILQLLYIKEFLDLKPSRVSPGDIYKIIDLIKSN